MVFLLVYNFKSQFLVTSKVFSSKSNLGFVSILSLQILLDVDRIYTLFQCKVSQQTAIQHSRVHFLVVLNFLSLSRYLSFW